MQLFVQSAARVYEIRVITPGLGTWSVECYGLRDHAEAVRLTRELAGLLTRVPTADDRPQFRDAWISLVECGVSPRACRAELAERAESAGGSAPNGWRTVLIVEPGVVPVSV